MENRTVCDNKLVANQRNRLSGIGYDQMTEERTKLGYIRHNHLDLLAVLFAALACYFAWASIKLARETIKLANESAHDTARQIKASENQLAASQEQLRLFQANLAIAKDQLESFRQYERATFAKPDFTISLELSPVGSKVPVQRQVFPRSVSETVEYGGLNFISLTIRNTGTAPARNVVVMLSVPDMQVFDQLGDAIQPFQAVNIRGFPNYPGGALNMRFPVIHPSERVGTAFPIQIKKDAGDGQARFIVQVEGDNLKQHYSRVLILRRATPK